MQPNTRLRNHTHMTSGCEEGPPPGIHTPEWGLVTASLSEGPPWNLLSVCWGSHWSVCVATGVGWLAMRTSDDHGFGWGIGAGWGAGSTGCR